MESESIFATTSPKGLQIKVSHGTSGWLSLSTAGCSRTIAWGKDFYKSPSLRSRCLIKHIRTHRCETCFYTMIENGRKYLLAYILHGNCDIGKTTNPGMKRSDGGVVSLLNDVQLNYRLSLSTPKRLIQVREISPLWNSTLDMLLSVMFRCWRHG